MDKLREQIERLRDAAKHRFETNSESYKAWPLAQWRAYDEVLKLEAALRQQTPAVGEAKVELECGCVTNGDEECKHDQQDE
jgi:hypothetical protein